MTETEAKMAYDAKPKILLESPTFGMMMCSAVRYALGSIPYTVDTHFFEIEFLKRKNNIALLADILGHSNVNVTQIYLRQSQEQQKSAVDEAVNW